MTGSANNRVVLALVAGITLLAGFGTLVSLRRAASASHRPAAAPTPTETASRAVDSNKEMADLLQSIARTIQPTEMPILINEARSEELRKMLERTTDFNQQRTIRAEYVTELLNFGHSAQALEECNKLERSSSGLGAILSSSAATQPSGRDDAVDIEALKAMCYLRMGEEQNCCARNTPQSCLVPIQGSGIHTKQEGSKRAMEVLEGILKQHPDDHVSRWLLAVAAMTLGKYPDGVPASMRVDPKAFRSDYDIKRFPNVASQVGLNLLGRAGGVIVDDLDGDGYLDVVVSGIGFDDHLRFFHNNGDATFTERTKEANLTGITGGLNIMSGDYDNDGRLDILVLRGGWMGNAGRFPFSLLHNDGGKFTDVTKKAGLLNPGPTQTAVWIDYNLDGKLDLFVGYETTPQRAQCCALYRNNGDGTFTDVTQQAGVGHVGMVKAVVSADYDKDGWPDLLLTSRGNGYVLYHNNGNGTFTDVTAKAGITGPKMGFGSFFFDYDNDGWPDIFVVDYDIHAIDSVVLDLQGKPVQCERSHLYRNNHHGGFIDVSHSAHLDRVTLTMGLNFGDLDNDGWLDFYLGTGNPDLRSIVPNRMFRNAEGRFFQEVTTSGGFGDIQKGHGVVFADINNDGQQDVFEQMGGANFGDTAYSTLYANPGHPGHWITLTLEGTKENRCAIGARITLTVNDGGHKRDIYRTVGPGASFGCNPLRQEIGIGRATRIEQVEIYWPVSRTTQTLTALAADHFYHIREGSLKADPIKLRSTPWSVAISNASHRAIASR